MSQEEVVLACVKFLGEVVGDMPKYEAFKPIRIIIAGEREDIPLRLN